MRVDYGDVIVRGGYCSGVIVEGWTKLRYDMGKDYCSGAIVGGVTVVVVFL